MIQLNDDDIPRLKLSSAYQELLKNDRTMAKEERQYLSSKMKDADWFIKSLYQRQRTIFKVMESILRFQYEFFEKGAEHLRPLILKDVAEDIEMHESTVSRVTSNKYVHTPLGIYELKYFFSTAIPREGEDAMASESIKTMIRKLIQEEDKKSPLSDNAISEKLAKIIFKLQEEPWPNTESNSKSCPSNTGATQNNDLRHFPTPIFYMNRHRLQQKTSQPYKRFRLTLQGTGVTTPQFQQILEACI